jgi:hypothetical protein
MENDKSAFFIKRMPGHPGPAVGQRWAGSRLEKRMAIWPVAGKSVRFFLNVFAYRLPIFPAKYSTASFETASF